MDLHYIHDNKRKMGEKHLLRIRIFFKNNYNKKRGGKQSTTIPHENQGSNY